MSSRSEDIKHLEREIIKLKVEQNLISDENKKYDSNTRKKIKIILERAGVWDEIHGIETERADRDKRDKRKISELDKEIDRLQEIKDFLMDRKKLEDELIFADLGITKEKSSEAKKNL